MLSSRFLHDVDFLRRRAACLPKLRRRRVERVNLILPSRQRTVGETTGP